MEIKVGDTIHLNGVLVVEWITTGDYNICARGAYDIISFDASELSPLDNGRWLCATDENGRRY